MMREMLKGKIHRAVVTDAALHYEGSISIDTTLLEAANILVGEKVLVVDIDSGSRFETYTMVGGPGEICVNGAAARLCQVGDKVIIMSFALMDDVEATTHEPCVIKVDERNVIVDKG